MQILIEVDVGYVAPPTCLCKIIQNTEGWRRVYNGECQAHESVEATAVPTTLPESVCCTEIVAIEPVQSPTLTPKPPLTLTQYIELPAINFSTLKYMAKSPQHYQWARNVGREDTTALMKFRAIHTAVLEPNDFDKRYVVYPGKTRRGKDWDAFCEEHAGCEIIKADEREKILNIAEAIWNHPVAGAIFAEGEAERSIAWTDPRTGLACKGRLDWWNPYVLADLKSGPVNARVFAMLAAKLYYHVQLSWYSDGLAIETGYRPPVKLVVAEPEPPHAVGVFSLGTDEIAIGREVYEEWLDRVIECERAGAWPGPYPNEEPLELPRYVYDDPDQEDGTSEIVEEGGEE